MPRFRTLVIHGLFLRYSLRDGASFVEQARTATFDLASDEAVAQQKRAALNWDKKKKKFVKGDGAGADNVKMVRTESGAKLPATYRSGRFDEWKTKQRVGLPKVGEAENETVRRGRGSFGAGGQRYKHQKITQAKPLDKLHTSYERKSRQLKKQSADGGNAEVKPARGGPPAARGSRGEGRFAGKSAGRVKSELKNAEQIRKTRKTYEQKRAKNARPSKKKGRR